MVRSLWVPLVAVGLFAGSGSVAAQETYQIKVKKEEQGDRLAVEKQDTDESHVKVLGPGDKVVNEQERKITMAMTYEETVLEKEKGQKKATRLTRKYEKAERTEAGKTETLPYQGKTVLIEKKDGKYHFKIEGGEEITGKDAAELNKEFNKENETDVDFEAIILPKKPVALNQPWKIDAQEFAKALEKSFTVDADKAVATGKLLRVYQKDGHQFGIMEITMDLPIRGSFQLGGNLKAELTSGSRMKVNTKQDLCIDGTLRSERDTGGFTMDVKATFKGPDGNDYKITIVGGFNGKNFERELARK